MIDLMGTVMAVVLCGEPPAVAPTYDEAPASNESTAAPSPSPAPQPADNGWGEVTPIEPPPPVVTTPPVPAQPQPPSPEELEQRRARSRALGLTVGGWTTFGVTYVVAMTIGVVTIDVSEDDPRLRRWGRRMAIPVAGPFAAAAISEKASAIMFTTLNGLAQTAGIAMGIAGAVLLARHKQSSRVAFGFAPDRNGVHMGATWRF